jgi:polygalacturonase
MLKLCTGTLCALAGQLILVALWQAVPWNVKESGARGNKGANDTVTMQTAPDKCAEAGGGTVYVPVGEYRCGQLQLRDNVTLHLEAGATLWVIVAKESHRRGIRSPVDTNVPQRAIRH